MINCDYIIVNDSVLSLYGITRYIKMKYPAFKIENIHSFIVNDRDTRHITGGRINLLVDRYKGDEFIKNYNQTFSLHSDINVVLRDAKIEKLIE